MFSRCLQTSNSDHGGLMGSLPEMMVQEMDNTLHPIRYSIMPSDTHSFIHTEPGVTSYTARTPNKMIEKKNHIHFR